MFFSDTIRLISADGSSREIYGDIKSAGQSEFFQAAQKGMKPECMIEVWAEEYQEERIAELSGKKLSIYRVFVKGEKMELYLTERAGLR